MRFVHLPARRHPAPYFGPVVLKLRRASLWLRSGKKEQEQAVNRRLTPIRSARRGKAGVHLAAPLCAMSMVGAQECAAQQALFRVRDATGIPT